MHKRPQDKTECPLYCLNCIYLAKGKKGEGTNSTLKNKSLSVVIVFFFKQKLLQGGYMRAEGCGDGEMQFTCSAPLATFGSQNFLQTRSVLCHNDPKYLTP